MSFLIAADPLLTLATESARQAPTSLMPSPEKGLPSKLTWDDGGGEMDDIQTIFIDEESDPQEAVLQAAEEALKSDKTAMKIFKKQARAYMQGDIEAVKVFVG